MSALAAVLLTSVMLGAGELPGSPEAIHELERTQVVVTFMADGAFQVDVLNDPDWLLARLESLSELPPSGRLDPAPRDRRLVDLEWVFTEWVWLYFDGVRLKATAEYIPPAPGPSGAADPPRATMRLRGKVPGGATTFYWAYGLVIDPYPMRVSNALGGFATRWVSGDLASDRLEMAALTPPTRRQVVRTYLGLGFTHILPKGLDHILFVIGIFLLSTRLKPIVAQVTTFTVAHTITLGLTIFGVLSLPAGIVEPLIALSIVYVAIENLMTSELKPWRIGLIFGFGLLHGMGFAGVLSDLGLPRSEFTTALVTFNLGVEGAQLTVIAVMFAALGSLRNEEWYRRRAVWPLSIMIAAVGLYWTVTRLQIG